MCTWMYVTSLFVRPQVGNNLNILQWMNGEINCGASYYVILVNNKKSYQNSDTCSTLNESPKHYAQ